MSIAFDADAFRKIAAEAGDITLEQIATSTGLDIAVLSRLLTGKRQPMFATAVQAARAYEMPMSLAKDIEAAPAVDTQTEDAA